MAQYQKRAKERFNESLKLYKAGLDDKLKKLKFRPAPKLRKTDHFIWLALYQVRGSSPSQISTYLLHEHAKDVTESGVLKAVRKKAKLIGLTLRPDNRGKGKKPRIVARDRAPKFGRLPISVTGLRKRPAMSP